MKRIILVLWTLRLLSGVVLAQDKDTFQPITKGGPVPQTFDELWKGYDPHAEPLEIETIRQWEQDSVVMRIVRYRVGIFKGKTARMAAIYGFPKGGTKLPGLVQVHGGGQYADYRAVLTNAKRGYATISIAWAGRINAPGYVVDPDIVKLFWDNKKDDPNYKLTTDWGALDAYHAPCRNEQNTNWQTLAPEPWTLDAVESPRNSNWFLCTLAARRALTFLEQQPEVDPAKLGVYGHSMGGQITVATASTDQRVKAAAPSCGGLSWRLPDSTLIGRTVTDNVNLRHITCPIIFLSPANDFNGRLNDLQKALTEIKSTDWRITSSPHHNHQDTPPYFVCGLLWFDQYLKSTFSFPQTPTSGLDLNTSGKVPEFMATIDKSKPILYVDVFYMQQQQVEGDPNGYLNTINRFWHYARATLHGGKWIARLPILTTGKPLLAYANVVYSLDKPVTGAEYYYTIYTAHTFNLSSKLCVLTPERLKAAKIKATDKPSLLIETFRNGWRKQWFTYDLGNSWARRTHKLYDDKWKAPVGANLELEIRSEKPNKMVVGIDQYAAEIQLAGDSKWQRVILSPSDFHNGAGDTLRNWNGLKELRLGPQETLNEKVGEGSKTLTLGAEWQGGEPKFRNLRWIIKSKTN
jgi:Dienelactone hydrolase family